MRCILGRTATISYPRFIQIRLDPFSQGHHSVHRIIVHKGAQTIDRLTRRKLYVIVCHYRSLSLTCHKCEVLPRLASYALWHGNTRSTRRSLQDCSEEQFVSKKYMNIMNPEKYQKYHFDNVHLTLGLADGDLDRKYLKMRCFPSICAVADSVWCLELLIRNRPSHDASRPSA